MCVLTRKSRAMVLKRSFGEVFQRPQARPEIFQQGEECPICMRGRLEASIAAKDISGHSFRNYGRDDSCAPLLP